MNQPPALGQITIDKEHTPGIDFVFNHFRGFRLLTYHVYGGKITTEMKNY